MEWYACARSPARKRSRVSILILPTETCTSTKTGKVFTLEPSAALMVGQTLIFGEKLYNSSSPKTWQHPSRHCSTIARRQRSRASRAFAHSTTEAH